MVVDGEVLRDRADANAAVTHRRDPRGDRLVNRRLDRLDELSLNQNLGNGAKPLRSRPPLLTRVYGVTYGFACLNRRKSIRTEHRGPTTGTGKWLSRESSVLLASALL